MDLCICVTARCCYEKIGIENKHCFDFQIGFVIRKCKNLKTVMLVAAQITCFSTDRMGHNFHCLHIDKILLKKFMKI